MSCSLIEALQFFFTVFFFQSVCPYLCLYWSACCALSCRLGMVFCNGSVTVQGLRPYRGLFDWALGCLSPTLRSRPTGIAWHWQEIPPKPGKWLRSYWGVDFLTVGVSLLSRKPYEEVSWNWVELSWAERMGLSHFQLLCLASAIYSLQQREVGLVVFYAGCVASA